MRTIRFSPLVSLRQVVESETGKHWLRVEQAVPSGHNRASWKMKNKSCSTPCKPALGCLDLPLQSKGSAYCSHTLIPCSTLCGVDSNL